MIQIARAAQRGLTWALGPHFTGASITLESPRDVFLAGCAEIAACFSGRGFRFAKSGPHASQKCGDFTHQISFQSSHHNSANVSVKLWVHATVFSKRLEAWRFSHPPLRTNDYVAGGQIGNLVHDTSWRDWDLADQSTRRSEIESAISTIESIAIPYFSQFYELDTLIATTQISDIPSMDIDRVIDFLLCFANQACAKTAAVNFLKRRPDLVNSYTQAFGQISERGLGQCPTGHANKLAFYSHLFQFGDLTSA